MQYACHFDFWWLVQLVSRLLGNSPRPQVSSRVRSAAIKPSCNISGNQTEIQYVVLNFDILGETWLICPIFAVDLFRLGRSNIQCFCDGGESIGGIGWQLVRIRLNVVSGCSSEDEDYQRGYEHMRAVGNRDVSSVQVGVKMSVVPRRLKDLPFYTILAKRVWLAICHVLNWFKDHDSALYFTIRCHLVLCSLHYFTARQIQWFQGFIHNIFVENKSINQIQFRQTYCLCRHNMRARIFK